MYKQRQQQQQRRHQEEQPAKNDAQTTGRTSRNPDHRRPTRDRADHEGSDNRKGAKRRLLPPEDPKHRKAPRESPNVKARVEEASDCRRGAKRPRGAGNGNGKDAGNDNDSSNENDNGDDASSGDAPGAIHKTSCAPPPRKRRRIDSTRSTPRHASTGS